MCYRTAFRFSSGLLTTDNAVHDLSIAASVTAAIVAPVAVAVSSEVSVAEVAIVIVTTAMDGRRVIAAASVASVIDAAAEHASGYNADRQAQDFHGFLLAFNNP